MILVDSSVWIDFFSASARPAGLELGRLIRDSAPVVLSGIVVTEVLQGLTRDYDQVEHYLSMWDILEPGGFTTYCQAAAIFRAGRSKGISLSKIDSLIAAIALEHGAIVFTLDTDFSRIASLTGLKLHSIAKVS